ncbi:MAG: OB-fold domain-containing protein, partial [Myxococcales bacterium]|nr:OB-fold domain-containing protein [Myxococcales bacterium]
LVLVPPAPYDPRTGRALGDDWVEVADTGVITGFTWVTRARPGQPLPVPFAWAFVQLDGAGVPFVHAVQAPSEAALSVGARVRAVWAEERVGAITDIACFTLEVV